MNQETMPLLQKLQTYNREKDREHNELGEKERKEILSRFPVESWAKLALERYALGLENSDTYSWWLEFGSPHLGSMAGGSARKHVIYKKKGESGWYFPRKYNTLEEAWNAVRSGFVKAFEFAKEGQWADVDGIESLLGAGALRVKTMHVYFPDQILPISSKDHMVHFLELLGVPRTETKDLKRVALNRKLLSKLREVPELQDWTTNELGLLLYDWADPRQTHRVVKIAPGENARYWGDCVANQYICVGWDGVGDLREFEAFEDFREKFDQVYTDHYKGHKATLNKKAKEVWTLLELEPGDVVIANQGISKILAIGRVVDPGYEWRSERQEYRHTVKVEWDESYAQDISPQAKWGTVTVSPVSIDLYQRILAKKAGVVTKPPLVPTDPLMLRISDSLEQKNQTILYGPPGTGKTYYARRFAIWWLLQRQGDVNAQSVLIDDQALVAAEQKLKTVQLSRKVWWVVANPKEWTWDQLFKDGRVTYRYGRLQRNYPLVQPKDLVIGYQSTPDKRIVALAEVSKGIDQTKRAEPTIELKPLRRVNNGSTYNDLAEDSRFKDSEPMRFRCQGTLFGLTSSEAEYLESILVDRDPELVDVFKLDGGVGQLTWVTFHPSYSYEDFIEGFRPVDAGQSLVLRLEDGVFKKICREAQTHPDRPYLLVVDEINRANVAKVLGELITLLEKDKRGMVVTLPQSKESFAIPPNVYLLGTMNTADRSIKLLDAALRRRFAFLELMPDVEVLRGATVNDLPLDDFLETLNRRIAQKEGREKQIGHAYLMDNGQPISDSEEFARRFRQEILPLLQEYCYDDYAALATYLGEKLVDSKNQILNEDLLADDNALIDALAESIKVEEG